MTVESVLHFEKIIKNSIKIEKDKKNHHQFAFNLKLSCISPKRVLTENQLHILPSSTYIRLTNY